MERSSRRVRRAYELAHLLAGAKAIVLAGLLTLFAAGLYHTTRTSWLVAGALAAALAVFAWRGGPWRRGALAGVLAGLPPLIVPSVIAALTATHPCASCQEVPTWPCVLACFGSSLIVGTVVGYRASSDRVPSAFASAALISATLTGLLGCGTIGLGGTLGVVIGLAGGAVTGWFVLRPATR